MAQTNLGNKQRQLNNQGSRRFIVGPPPKSKRGEGGAQKVIVLGTEADAMLAIPADQKLPNVGVVDAVIAERPGFKAAADACRVRVA